jgi:hypothetical protein
MRPPDPSRKSQDRASPWSESRRHLRRLWAILEQGIYNDADKGSGSLEPFQGMTSMTAARRNLLSCKVPC